MAWKLDDTRPIYLQLVEQIEQAIMTGVYGPGDKLPSVRDFALEASVNPNTMQKALTELELSGLVYTKRTSGRFITEDKELIAKMKTTIACDKVNLFLKDMKALGFSKKEILDLIDLKDKEEAKNE